MNFFSWFGKIADDNELKDAMSASTRERFTPASTLISTSIMVLAELSKTQEEMLARREKMLLAKRAEAIGFTNSYEVAEQRQFNKNVELLRFILEMWRDLGVNTILVSFSHFREILSRHDLMCVPFEAYKGNIPTKNLAEIEKAKEALAECGMGAYSKPLSYDAKWIGTSDQLMEFIRFPYWYKNREAYFGPGVPILLIDTEPKASGHMFIAAPKDFVEKPTVKLATSTIESQYARFPHLYNEEYREYSNKVKAANRMLRGVSGYVNAQYSTTPKILPYNYDPFVCSICDYGVIIHSMWGPEAEDAIIERYKELRDKIIGTQKTIAQ